MATGGARALHPGHDPAWIYVGARGIEQRCFAAGNVAAPDFLKVGVSMSDVTLKTFGQVDDGTVG